MLSDVPFECAEKIIEGAKQKMKKSNINDSEALYEAVRESIVDMLKDKQHGVNIKTPAVIIVTGVNGAGKTTSIAKLALWFKNRGKSVILAAADTFRAAASDQLGIWAKRLNVPIVKSAQGQDPSSVIFDALKSAKAKGSDIVLCDTAGRLQNKANLMNELEKIYRVCSKFKDEFNVYSVVVLDAMLGSNSISQLEAFSSVMNVDGVILTKMDGCAKGGVVLGIADKFDMPVWHIGTGENAEDLAVFDAVEYANAII